MIKNEKVITTIVICPGCKKEKIVGISKIEE